MKLCAYCHKMPARCKYCIPAPTTRAWAGLNEERVVEWGETLLIYPNFYDPAIINCLEKGV